MTSTTYDQKLKEVAQHLHGNDIQLAYRRLLDCVLEVSDIETLRKALEFCDWFEKNQNSDSFGLITEGFQGLMQHLEKVYASHLVPKKYEKPLLQLENVSKTYKKGSFGLHDISLQLHYGEIIGLVGENGNGKTTLLRLVANELKADKGKIQYAFADSNDDYILRTKLVYIEQRIPRWYGTLMENLYFTLSMYGYSGEQNTLRAELMVARLGLRPFRNLTWNQISSGYKTRFELAKNLLRSPNILLLDEPLANLDILSQQTILQDLKFMSSSVNHPFGMILSSQHIYEVEKVSDKVVYLKAGRAQYQETQNTTEQSETQNTNTQTKLFELELQGASKEQVLQELSSLKVTKVSFNGGVFLIECDPSVSLKEFLNCLANSNLQIIYLRDISASSRRFFL
jgi:ABC-2 type transport system ATP-binding protein